MAKNLLGLTFGWLTVVESQGSINNNRAWLCRCECGNERVLTTSKLNGGHHMSCGCRRGGVTHGHTRNRTYTITFKTWEGMLSRCKSHKSYAGKGIKVCDRWQSSFEDFLADMGERPSLKHTLDRIDPKGNYEPLNCRWATKFEQANNRTNNTTVSYMGETITLSELAKMTGISYDRLRHRIVRAGWPVELAVTTPHAQGQSVGRCNITNS